MSKRADFSQELNLVKTTAEEEVASLLRLVDHERNAAAESIAAPSKPRDVQLQPSNLTPERVAEDSPPRRPAERERSDGTILDNVTTRLTRATNELLTEAALRQKLAKQAPDTRQDIIEQALQDWFTTNGYGRLVG